MLYDQHGVDGEQFNGIEQVGFLFSSCNGTQDAGVSRISRACVRQRGRGRTAGARAPARPKSNNSIFQRHHSIYAMQITRENETGLVRQRV